MAQTPDDIIQTVLSALEVFGSSTDKTAIDKANRWLQDFQHTPDSWSTASILLLSPSVPPAGRTFAAQTFRAKVTHDLHQLIEPAQRVALRDSLISAIQQFANGPRNVLVQICLALSGLALQLKEWEDAVETVIRTLGQNPATVPALLTFLTVLPEEVSSNTRIPMSHDDYRYQEARLLTGNAAEVLKLLTMYIQAPGVTLPIQAQIFKCVRSWLIAGEISTSMLAESPLFQLAFDGLNWNELFDPAVDVICDLIHETQEVEDNMDVIQRIVPLLVALKPKLGAAREAEDTDKVRGYCRIFTEAGETYRLLVIQHPDTFFPIVEAIGECAAYPDLDVIPITFHFWLKLSQIIGKKQDVSPVFFDAYRALMDIIIKHLHFPADPEAMTSQERDDFRGFRHIMGDTLKDCCYVLGTEACLLKAYEMIVTAMSRGASGDGTVSWQEIEAPLFSLRSMGAEINPDDDDIIPKIMDLIPKLPTHPRVRYAATLVISRYTEWTDRHPEYIPFQLEYISTGFDDPNPEVAAAAGQAMKYMCKDCRRHLVPYLPQLHTFVKSVGPKLVQDDRLQVYEAIAYIISSMPMEDAGSTLRMFALDLVSQIHQYISKPTGATKDELQSVADALELLEAMLHVVQTFGEDLPAACKDTCAEVYLVFDTLLIKHGNHYFISERVCRVLRLGIQFFGDSGAQVAPGLLARLADCFAKTGFSSFVWIQGKAIGQYGTTTDPLLLAAFQAAFETTSSKVFDLLKNLPSSDIPDVMEDYVQLLLQIFECMPDNLILSPRFPAIVQTVLSCLTLVHPDINHPALDLIRRLLAHESLSVTSDGVTTTTPQLTLYANAIRQIVADQGFQLLGLILTGLVTHFQEETNSLVITILRVMADMWPNELATWLQPVVDQIPVTALPLPAKNRFLSDFGSALATRNSEAAKNAVVALCRLSRKARDRRRSVM